MIIIKGLYYGSVPKKATSHNDDPNIYVPHKVKKSGNLCVHEISSRSDCISVEQT